MSGSSTALALTQQRTPIRSTPGSNTPATESPGTWQHPRIDEITRRQNASVFNCDNAMTIAYNIGMLIALFFLHKFHSNFGPKLL